MAYLLDSDWLIDRLADRPDAVNLFSQLVPSGLAVSVNTSVEVFQGAERDPDPASAEQRLDAFVATVRLLPITPEIARRCAFLRRNLKRRGRRINPRALDLLIAATALEHGLTLVTRSVDDYADIPNLSRLRPSSAP